MLIKTKSHTFSDIHLQGNFDKAVEILKPLRYKVDLLGGSRAQVRSNVSLSIRRRRSQGPVFSAVTIVQCHSARRLCRVNFDGGNVVVT